MNTEDNSRPKVALIPDRFAHYRYPLFSLLGDQSRGGVDLTIFADKDESRAGIKLAPTESVDDYKHKNFQWQPTIDFSIGKIIWQFGVVKACLTKDFDVFVFWGEARRPSTWLGALCARLRNKKVVFWTHGLYGTESKVKLKITTLFYRIAHSLLLYGEYGKKLLMSAGLDASKLHVIYNSLDVSRQLEVIAHLPNIETSKQKIEPFTKGDRVLAFIGRLQSNKKLDFLLRALAGIHQYYVDHPVKLLIIGDGPNKDALVSLAEDLNISNLVHFHGPEYDDNVILPLLAGCDALVSPGEIGLTAMHALIAGVPIVTHNSPQNQMPEYEAIIDFYNGVLFENDNLVSLQEAIAKVLKLRDSGKLPPEQCREVILEKYNPKNQQRIFNRVIQQLTTTQ